MKQLLIFLIFIGFTAQAQEAIQGLRMPAIFTDNMVLQRNRQLPISGLADAGETVVVTIDGQKQTAIADANGKWKIVLNPLSEKKALTLTIETKRKKLAYHNVLAGEVWLCSGQSNMGFPLKSATTAKEDIAKASNKHIRLFTLAPRWETNASEWSISALDSVNRKDYLKASGWLDCDPQSAASFSAVAYHFGQTLADSLQVPIGLICNAVGGSPCESWISSSVLKEQFPEILEDWLQNGTIQEWVRGRARLNIKKSTDKQQQHPYEPGYLFESGVIPLNHFPIRGVIWYQGESNAQNPIAHEKLFGLLVDNWRSYWKDSLLPFYYVQLSGMNRIDWPEFRDSQRQLMHRIPHTGMAVSSDKGDSLDVHPRQKREVGQRLAYWALNQTYHHPAIPSGPLFRKAVIQNDTISLSFDYAESMTTSDGMPLRTFEVAGTDKLYVPAQAKINGNTIHAWSEKVTHPCFVRYGWQPFTRANLINGAGLPASTFQTTCMMNKQVNALPGYPIEKGVSAPFIGIHNEKLIVAGGCNFPGTPVVDGGKKVYYNELFVLDAKHPENAQWKGGYRLPFSVAYGASVTIPQGIVCIGGQNADSLLRKVTLIQWDDRQQQPILISWPELPEPIDNATAVYSDKFIYLLGGNRSGKPSTSVFRISVEQPTTGWEECPPFPGPYRIQPVAVAFDGRVLLAGGFQPAINGEPPVLSSDYLAYDTSKRTWEKAGSLPVDEQHIPRCLVGGNGVPFGEDTFLFLSGVHYERFLTGLQRDQQTQLATAKGDTVRLKELKNEYRNYMMQPAEWYQFNTDLLSWNAQSKTWTNLGKYPELARAGAGVFYYEEKLFVICGELKPGIRTPDCNYIVFK